MEISNLDGLPFYSFRKGLISYDDFIKTFTGVFNLKAVLKPLSPNDLADMFAKIENKELRVDTILISAITYSDIRKWGRDVLDIESKRSELEKGVMGHVWGADIVVTKNMPNNLVLVTAEEMYNTCAILELNQEDFYGLTGLNELLEIVKGHQRGINIAYEQIDSMINRAIDQIKQEPK